MSHVMVLHDAMRRGDLERVRALLDDDAHPVNAPSDTDPRRTSSLARAEVPSGCAIAPFPRVGTDSS
jgi:hypothetical protein